MNNKAIYILSIESSCDDTSAAVLRNDRVLSNLIANQKVHEEWGGVVPELASRAHQENIWVVVDAALKNADITKEQLSGIAVTQGPGLIGSLMVGVSFAKAMAYGLGIPLIGVNHMQAHILAHFIDDPKPKFPFISLTVSGGHTQIVWLDDYLKMNEIGKSIDDAVGEAFDKIGKMLGLPYPAGPVLDKLAQKGNPKSFKFPFPKVEGYNYSFSGIKTAVLYFIEKQLDKEQFIKDNLNDLCASVQYTIVEYLLLKLKKIVEDYPMVDDFAISGGVSANSGLRKVFAEFGERYGKNTFVPKFEYCTDNAAMIGICGYYKFLKQEFEGLEFEPKARIAVST